MIYNSYIYNRILLEHSKEFNFPFSARN